MRHRVPRHQHGGHGRAGGGGKDQGGMPEGTYRAGDGLCELCAGLVQGKSQPFPFKGRFGTDAAGVRGRYPAGGAGGGVRLRGGQRAPAGGRHHLYRDK